MPRRKMKRFRIKKKKQAQSRETEPVRLFADLWSDTAFIIYHVTGLACSYFLPFVVNSNYEVNFYIFT